MPFGGQRLAGERIRLRGLPPLLGPPPLQRLDGTRLVVVQNGVELLWQPSLEVVALECDCDVGPAPA
jgi:hypothetical protein